VLIEGLVVRQLRCDGLEEVADVFNHRWEFGRAYDYAATNKGLPLCGPTGITGELAGEADWLRL
jgi:hypothetical protein